MRGVVYLTAVKKDQSRMTRRGKDVQKLIAAITQLATDGSLPPRYGEHKLQGKWLGYWECHIENDWLVVYVTTEKLITVVRTGSHSDIFD